MRHYEVMVILDPDLEERAVAPLIGVEDDHHLVVTHVEPTSFGLSGHGRSVAGGL